MAHESPSNGTNGSGPAKDLEEAKSIAGRLIASAAVSDPGHTNLLAERINASWDMVEQDPARTEAIAAVLRQAMSSMAGVLTPTEIQEVIDRLWSITTKLKKGFQNILDGVLGDYVEDPDHEGSIITLPPEDTRRGLGEQNPENN